MKRPAPYRASARFYDAISAEQVYRSGRRAGIECLELKPGDVVLDLGCGTGLNFSYLQDEVTDAGRIIGVDRSADMLLQARRRAERNHWDNVELLHANVTDLDIALVRDLVYGGQVDAAISSYALSLMPQWESAWQLTVECVRPGGRVAVVDMQRPTAYRGLFTPLARLACWFGGSDIDAHPWSALERDCVEVHRDSAWGEHIQVRCGRVP